MIKPSWIENKKMRNVIDGTEVPWCRVEGPAGMTREVIKVYTNDPTAEYSRWMVKAWMEGQGGEAWADYGDEYVANIVIGELVEVMGRPPTGAELIEWTELKLACSAPGWSI